MNDAICEHIVARKSKPMDFVIRILIIVVIVAIAIGGMPFLGFFAFALAAVLALLAYYFAFPLLNAAHAGPAHRQCAPPQGSCPRPDPDPHPGAGLADRRKL